ncbi:MAG: transporter substrate-binding protein, partial [Hyphomicrobiales bacterium]|nr:transporter substrate-binding protein [Hyphomicrobiales bacterium]
AELGLAKDVRIYSVPMENTVQYLGMNVEMKPFDDVRVRQAIAYAVPYQEILDLAMFKRARPLFGGPDKVSLASWPQPHRYVTDLSKAKALLTEAGYPEGFEVPLSFDLGAASTNEPLCVLIQEQFAKLGIRVKIDKVPGANWRPTFMKKQLPLQVNVFGAWFNYPDYFFHLVYSGENTIFNTMSYKNAEMDAMIEAARFPVNAQAFDKNVIGFIQKEFDDVPNIPLFQPYLDVAMRSNVSGYTYWFHREVDYRSFRKA